MSAERAGGRDSARGCVTGRRWVIGSHSRDVGRSCITDCSIKSKIGRANSHMDAKQFYRSFEDRFRGPRETIMLRLAVYLPFINPLTRLYDGCHALDLGCGRGEWLELIGGRGFNARGVDLDEGMLQDCRARGERWPRFSSAQCSPVTSGNPPFLMAARSGVRPPGPISASG